MLNGNWTLGKYDSTDSLSAEAIMINSNNVYCVEHNQQLTGNMTYERICKVTIDGWDAYFEYKGETYYVNHYSNNTLAAILTPNSYIPYIPSFNDRADGYTIGWGSSYMSDDIEKRYSEAQLGLYNYWNKWVNYTGASKYGIEASSWNPTDTSVGQAMKDAAHDLNDIYDFKIEIHFLKAVRGWQNLIAVYPSSPREKGEDTTNITVTKYWDDSNNAYNTRPGSISVTLKADGVATNTATLSASNNWSYTFYDLPVTDIYGYNITYTAKESVPVGYNDSYSNDGLTITNTLKMTSVTVKKVWNDEQNRDRKRPNSITVTLKANGETFKTQQISGTGDVWTYTFGNLPQYINGKFVTYTIEETDIGGYTKNISGNATNGYTITNTYIPQKTQVKVTKVWNDVNNAEKIRPSSVTVTLLKDGQSTGQTQTLSAGNNWTYTFSNLYKYENGSAITYTIQENGTTQPYTKAISGNATNGFIVTNTYIPKTQVTVKKNWNDGNNRDGKRPSSINVTLYQNGTSTNKTVTLNSANSWTYTFGDLLKYSDDGKLITYTVKETSVPTGYSATEANASNKYTITNTHTPETTEVKVTKKWDDMDDLDDLRPSSIQVTLYANGSVAKDANGKTMTATLSAANQWTTTFTNLYKNESGIPITYTVGETVPSEYTATITGNQTNGFTITNKHVPYYAGYVEITGKVWLDGSTGKESQINGTFGSEDSPLKGIKVILRDGNGNQFDTTSIAYTEDNGNYTIRVNYDNSKNVYKLYQNAETVKTKLKTSYVEFEYDGMKYTTVATADTGENTSKAIENETKRNNFDAAHGTITSSTAVPQNWKDKNITAVTKSITSYNSNTITRNEVVKCCNGNGTYNHTNHINAWGTIETRNCNHTDHKSQTYGVQVEVIPNINLGLFEREQPDVAIFSDLTKVEVIMNNQQYTYLYGVRNTTPGTFDELQVKFQNKGTYTYKRPVNPADIAYINDGQNNANAMQVYVTYEVKAANLSSTLITTINEIINVYDSQYEIDSIIKGKNSTQTVANEASNVYTSSNEFKEAKLKNLQITMNPQTEATDNNTIIIRYKVNQEAIKGLLNNEATLNNAVEIYTYSTQYGSETLYAQQGNGGRTNKLYGGYDEDSHPGNAGIVINNAGRLEATKAEDDTDISPSFVLYKNDDNPKTLAGIVWEDADANSEDDERLGNGKYDSGEKNAENVKVELYNIDGTRTYLYDASGTKKDAIVYTKPDGSYVLEGVVTGEYFIKYTYGNDTEKTHIVNEQEEKELQNVTKIAGNVVNARNNKSTIITDSKIKEVMSKNYGDTDYDEKWHITHQKEYSVAVDNMLDRLAIEDLTYSNFDNGENMTAYTKPFKTQVEFEVNGEAQVDVDGNITGVTNKLDKLYFGIIERPRENIELGKTITNFKIILANGQVLTEGNPSDPNAKINYAKAMGFQQNLLEKQLLVEIDAELMQGAQLEIQYAVQVTNNNEIDYDYGVTTDYTDIKSDITVGVCDEYITKNAKANYYYYGNSAGLDEIEAIIEFADYLNKGIVYKTDLTKWETVDANILYQEGLISENVKKTIDTDGYVVLQNASGTSTTLGRTKTLTKDMTASKLLSNQDENVFDNNIEILKIDGKTARTVHESNGEVQIQKTYKPGNYVPSLNSRTLEQDEDRVKIVITPPTGETNYIITYVLTALSGLIIIFAGVLFIKKKILIK